jgi:hypothetical protein
VVKTKVLGFVGGKLAPVVECMLQQHKCPDNVGLDEGRRTIDGTIDMALRGQVHDKVGAIVREQLANGLSVGDVGPNKAVPKTILYRCQRVEIAGLGKIFDDQDLVLGRRNQMPHYG